MDLTIIIPTLTTEDRPHLDTCLQQWEATLEGVEYETLIYNDFPGWGLAVTLGVHRAKGRYILASADDAPCRSPGWFPYAAAAADRGEIAGSIVIDGETDKPVGYCERLEQRGYLLPLVIHPFANRYVWRRLMPFPPCQHYSDVFMADKARKLGIPLRCIPEWIMRHEQKCDDLPGDALTYEVWKEVYL